MRAILFTVMIVLLIIVLASVTTNIYWQLAETKPVESAAANFCAAQPDWTEPHWQEICRYRHYVGDDCKRMLTYFWRQGDASFDPALALRDGCKLSDREPWRTD